MFGGYKKGFAVLLSICCVFQYSAAAFADTYKTQLTPEEITFRKVWNYRNLFNSQVDLGTLSLSDAAGAGINPRIWKTADTDQLTLKNTGTKREEERIQLGGHKPYGAYDMEITKQEEGSSVGLELYQDDQNRVLLTSEYDLSEETDSAFFLPDSYLDFSNVNLLTVYKDMGNNTLESTGETLKFLGSAGGGRGENFVRIASAQQNFRYEATVTQQSAVYGNAILKLRKDAQNGIFLVTNAQGVFSYEIFKDGKSQGGSQVISAAAPAKPYTIQMEIDGKNLVFTRLSNGTVQAAKTVDVSNVFDLSDPAVLKDFEAVFGFRGGSGDYAEYSNAASCKKYDSKVSVGFNHFTQYNDVLPANVIEKNGETLRFSGSTAARAESFVPIGPAAQGIVYEATVSGQSTDYGNAILKLRKDAQNGIFLVTNAQGALSYEIFKDGKSQGGPKAISAVAPAKPYTIQMEIDGKNLIFTRLSNGTVQAAKTVDVSGVFDLSDPAMLRDFEAVFGFRGSNQNYVEYASAALSKAAEAGTPGQSGLRLQVFNGGNKTLDEIIPGADLSAPYTLRADFAAESIRSSGTNRSFLSVWQVRDGKATLLKNNIDIKTDFSNPSVVGAYKACLYSALNPGKSATVSGFSSYINSGAAQADPKPLHDETGAILQNGDTIWLGMTVRGYDIHSSYQGVYSLNMRTGELKIVGLLAFNLDGSGHYAPYHAADIIYNSMADQWIVMPTAHNESPHSVKMGIIPRDPRTTSFQFVDVTAVKYPNQNNEEDASLIYDRDAAKWRLVMCDSGTGGYQLPLYESDSWNGEYREIARYAQAPCTGIQLQKLDGQYYVFFGRNTDNCEALRYPQMDQPVKLKIQSSTRSYNVWPVIIPFRDEKLGRERLFMISFDRDTHGGAHSYGNLYLYEAQEYAGMPAPEERAPVQDTESIVNGEIRTPQQLMQIRNHPDGDYVLKNDIDLIGVDNWVPIGDQEAPFNGTFDGGGYTIRNLTINRANTNEAGLFGHLGSDAQVKDLMISSARVKGNIYAGALAGYNEGTISGSSASGKVEAFSAAGVLVGQNTGKIRRSSAAGSVISAGGSGFGGLAGVNSANIGAIDLDKKGIIEESLSTATVKGGNNVGGLVGHNDCGRIEACYATGEVSGVAYVGGFVGNVGKSYGNSSLSPLINSYAAGNVKGEYSVGGFAGCNDGLLQQCFSSGNVEGDRNVGGLVGSNNNKADVKSAYTVSSVRAENSYGGTLFGWNRGGFLLVGASSSGTAVGNSRLTIVPKAPDFTVGATYAADGPLSGYADDTWTITNGQYPALTNVPEPSAPKTDRDHLNDLIAACEALEESRFEAESWTNLQAKLSAAKEVAGNPDATSEAIGGAFDQLSRARNDLVRRVDKDILRLSIEIAQNTDTTGCTSGSIAALNEALEAAQNVLNQADATQEEVNDAAKALLSAIINLKDIMADKAELQKLADLAAGLTEAKYTPASWSTVKAALEAAQVLLPDDDATQEAVDGAYGTLAQAIAHLTLRAQTNSLNVAIELAQTIVSQLDQYAPATVEGLQEKLDAAKAVQGDLNATQEEVDAAAKALAEAAAQARLKANKKDLQQTYAQAQKLDAGKYTEGSVKRLSAALTTTAAVLKNENATQQEVDKAKSALTDAVRTLEVKPMGGTENSSSESSSSSNSSNPSSGSSSSGNGSSSSLNSSSSEHAAGTVSTVPTGTVAEDGTDSPQTGEPSTGYFWEILVGVVALAGLVFLILLRKGKLKKTERP